MMSKSEERAREILCKYQNVVLKIHYKIKILKYLFLRQKISKKTKYVEKSFLWLGQNSDFFSSFKTVHDGTFPFWFHSSQRVNHDNLSYSIHKNISLPIYPLVANCPSQASVLYMYLWCSTHLWLKRGAEYGCALWPCERLEGIPPRGNLGNPGVDGLNWETNGPAPWGMG